MKVGKLLEDLGQQLTTCRPEDTLQTVATVLTAKGVGALPVCDENRGMVGIVSERDLVKVFAHRGGETGTLRVRDIMTTNVICCSPEDSLEDARALLQRHRFRHLPVLRSGKIAGIISIRDLLETRLEETALEVNVLRDSVIAARSR
jgi:CBS domain-containing protein